MIRTFDKAKSILFSLLYFIGYFITPAYSDVDAVKLYNYEGNLSPVTICVVNGQTKVISPGPYDKTLRIWDVTTGDCEGIIGIHEGFVRSVTTCIVDGKIKVIAGYDNTFSSQSAVNPTIRIWDLQTGNCEHALRRHMSTTKALATFVIEENPKILSGSGIYHNSETFHRDGDLHIWDIKTGQLEQTLRGHDRSIEAVTTCNVDGKTKLISASRDKTVRIWDAKTGICEHILEGHKEIVNSVASFIIDNQAKIISGSEDGVVRVWDAKTATCEHILEGPESTGCLLTSAVINGELKLVVGFQSIYTYQNDHLVTIWDPRTGIREHTIPMATRFDSVFSFIQNGKCNIVIGFRDGVMIIF